MTTTTFLLLVILARGPRHGLALAGEVAAISHGTLVVSTGTVYRALRLMRRDGLVEEVQPSAPAVDRRSERRRTYAITDRGRDDARRQAQRLQYIMQAVEAAGLARPPRTGAGR